MPKRKATAAQLRNLAKGRKKLAAMRRSGKKTRKKRGTRRANPASHMTFKSLPIGAGFVFASEEDERFRFSGMARGPWRKVSARTYEDETGTRHRVGSINVKVILKNPAYGNFMTARNVLKTGRTTNPKRRSYSGGIPPGTKGRALHNIIASIDPRSGRTVWWGAFGWGPDKKAVTFSDIKNAKYVANKMKRPVVIAKEFTSAHELGKVLRGET